MDVPAGEAGRGQETGGPASGFMCYQPHVSSPVGSNLHLLSSVASDKPM